MNNNINIPKPPEPGNKTAEEYTKELHRWACKIYDAIRHITEIGGNKNGDSQRQG